MTVNGYNTLAYATCTHRYKHSPEYRLQLQPNEQTQHLELNFPAGTQYKIAIQTNYFAMLQARERKPALEQIIECLTFNLNGEWM